jgi:hypothetical protein
MKTKPIASLLLIVGVILGSLPTPSRAAQQATQIIYDDALASGWDNWSWAQVNLSASSPVHSGAHSIAVTFDAWEGLYLHKATIDTLGMSHLSFYLHGGSSGGQKMNLFMNLVVNGSAQNGPLVSIPAPPASSWIEVKIPLSSLNPGGAAVTGLTWQDSSGGSQPTFYIDDIAFTSDASPDAPQLTNGSLQPRAILAGSSAAVVVRVQASDPQGAADIAAVTLDAAGLGAGVVALYDDGRNNDGLAGDGLYGAVLSVASGAPTAELRLLLSAVDQAGHTSSLPLGSLIVLAPPGGSIPASLPQRIGWGSNAWSETPGQDWQENSGVPWDYVYQYITYGWESWGGSFVSRFVNQAWDKGFIPMVTVYLMLGVPPDCGEGGACYAQKLQNATTVQNYLASLQRAAQEASGSQPVIFNLEPDFYGFMQQLSNSSSRPIGVAPDDPSSYPVALNKAGYANNLSGFGRYLVDLVHATAPNALVAPMASTWATNGDPQFVTADEAAAMAQRTAAFIDAMGGAQADLLVIEWSDRDAGSGLRPWWDDSDMETPRPTRAMLWANTLSLAAGKRLFLWQMPVGNMALENVCDRYQDNRAAYAFNHPRDLFEAGVVGVLFGGGAACMTQVWTDGGFVASQGAIAYAVPAAPTGLSLGGPAGLLVSAKWDDLAVTDLWRYRLEYRLQGSPSWQTLDAGRRTTINLLLPGSGVWELRVRAQDAMGNYSEPSTVQTVIISAEAHNIFFPLLRR